LNIDPSDNAVNVLSDALGCASSARSGYGVRTLGGYDLSGGSKFDYVITNSCHSRAYVHLGMDAADPLVKINPTALKTIIQSGIASFGWDADIGDLDDDGDLDLVFGSNGTAGAGGSNITIFYNSGVSPYFSDVPGTTITKTDFFGWSVAVGDFNGDGSLDLAVGSAEDSANGILHIYY
jgi:hypothetical protein